MPRKKEYTREIHIKRLAVILNSNKKLCNYCPAAKYYNGRWCCFDLWTNPNKVCIICGEFVGYHPRYPINCPCIKFGYQKALDITLEKMEEEEYTVF